ncbi:MAG: hypothetical protein BGO01_17775 [Armatimonadetes bacterium 55-13]|nr:hypothetical protein [Armatimonadota bacterium]OJU63990.1 MAG: hypothetical protein BGO01_17775 [Armatimonadetes bacterium 55-13]
MSYRGDGSGRGIAEAFHDFLTGAAKLLLYAGLFVGLASVGFLIYTAMVFGGGSTGASEAQALSNIDLFQKLMISGLLGAGIGSAFLFWGEELLGAIQVILAGILYFMPLILSSAGVQADNKVVQAALGTIQTGGAAFGVLAICVLVFDIANRMVTRVKQGSKADQIKLGKGIKEEADRQNVFLGKCWQLPFCRKFVREKCPIYHARRTCWREQVGCMCEEQVIRGAMENKAIPKDVVAAAKFIPQNNKLTVVQKRERCKQCVIYNEHQKHKYRAALPAVIVFFIAFYAVCRGFLLSATEGIIQSMNSLVGRLTFSQNPKGPGAVVAEPFQEMLLICVMIILMTYALKLLEYLIFKLKI